MMISDAILLNSIRGLRYVLEQVTSCLGWRHSIERLRVKASEQKNEETCCHSLTT